MKTKMRWKAALRPVCTALWLGLIGFAWAAGVGDPKALAEGNTAFAFDLYKELKANGGNVFVSPYSISVALGMTRAGARGETALEMDRTLHFGEGTAAAFGALQRQMDASGKDSGNELLVGNALWAQKRHPFLPEFLATARRDYGAMLNQADFKNEAEKARGEINQWVAQQTRDRILNLLPPGSVNPLTRLVLANAVYFKGKWAKPFKKEQTTPQTFHVSATELTRVPLMHQINEVRYAEDEMMQIVELPYEGGDLCMLIVLPKKAQGLGELEAVLSPAWLAGRIGSMRARQVELLIPRFKIDSMFSLGDVLMKMGMPKAFGVGADFSGMDGERDLHISRVFHKAWGEVNEEGTEAAAATGTWLVASSAEQPPPPVLFRADHPFLFFIRHPQSGTLLFAGRFAKPVRE